MASRWLDKKSDESLLHQVPAGETDVAAFPPALLHEHCDVWLLLPFPDKIYATGFLGGPPPSVGDLRCRSGEVRVVCHTYCCRNCLVVGHQQGLHFLLEICCAQHHCSWKSSNFEFKNHTMKCVRKMVTGKDDKFKKECYGYWRERGFSGENENWKEMEKYTLLIRKIIII
jgi:hypothetical protein